MLIIILRNGNYHCLWFNDEKTELKLVLQSDQVYSFWPYTMSSWNTSFWTTGKTSFEIIFLIKTLFGNVSIPHIINRCHSVIIPDCTYPDKKTVKLYCVKLNTGNCNADAALNRVSTKLFTYCSFTTKMQLSCDGCPVTGCLQVTFLSLWLKEKRNRENVWMYFRYHIFLIFL